MREHGIFARLGMRVAIGLGLLVLSFGGRTEADLRRAPDTGPGLNPLLYNGAPGDIAIDHVAADPTGVGDWVDGVLSATAHQGDPYAAVDACLQQEMRDKGVKGASIAIAADGALDHASAFGVRRADSPELVDTETIFRINSTTKMMAAAAVMQLVEQGKLDLHAPLTDYVPELVLKGPWAASSLTLHTLLANAGAVPDPYIDFAQVPRHYVMPDWDMDLTTWSQGLVNMHLYAPPGTFWNYSSPNFSLASLPVERLSGLSFEDYVTERLWRPAGMTVTTFHPEAVVASGNYAMGHQNGKVVRAPADYQRVYAAPAGGAYSTPTELITWALQLIADGGEILAPESVRAMTTPYFKAEAVPWTPRSSYGYGIFIDEYRAVDNPSRVFKVMRHPGNGRGYSTEFVWVPELRFAVVTLINDLKNMHGTVDCALRQVAGLEPRPISGLKTPPARWGKYTGTYAITDLFGARWTGRVWLSGRQLNIVYPDWTLVPAIAAALPDGAPMEHYFLDTFAYTYAGNKTVTFEEGGGDSAYVGWLRNQYFVGQRVGTLPRYLTLEGRACATLPLTAGLDAPDLRVRAHGLNEPLVWRNEAIVQDDPEDPSSSRVKILLDVPGTLGYLTAWLFEEADDNLEMYLMQDQDGDGHFAWPKELVQRLTAPVAQGMFVPERSGPGAYELWIHGAGVSGTGSEFGLDVVAISGDELRLAGLPRSVKAGEATSFEVCAEPGSDYDTGRVGVVEFDFGAPGAVARVPVYWEPGDDPEPPRPVIYLPMLPRRDG